MALAILSSFQYKTIKAKVMKKVRRNTYIHVLKNDIEI